MSRKILKLGGGDWTNWEEYKTVHRPSGPCMVMMKRWRYCERTHCGASQTETDGLYVTSCHGNGIRKMSDLKGLLH